MPLLIESIASRQTICDLLREIIISSMSILVGLVLKELIIDITSYLNPDTKPTKLIFGVFVFLVVLFITITLVLIWK
jgi:hypothetical protein